MAQSVVIGLLCSDWSDGIGLPLQHESETKPITISEYPQRLLHNNTNSSDGILFFHIYFSANPHPFEMHFQGWSK